MASIHPTEMFIPWRARGVNPDLLASWEAALVERATGITLYPSVELGFRLLGSLPVSGEGSSQPIPQPEGGSILSDSGSLLDP